MILNIMNSLNIAKLILSFIDATLISDLNLGTEEQKVSYWEHSRSPSLCHDKSNHILDYESIFIGNKECFLRKLSNLK